MQGNNNISIGVQALCAQHKRTKKLNKSLTGANLLVCFSDEYKGKSHHLVDACNPRTSHFHCSFAFALVLHNWKESGETGASFNVMF